MQKLWCPECKCGWVIPPTVAHDKSAAWVCENCKTTWLGAGPKLAPEVTYGSVVDKHGPPERWSPLDVLAFPNLISTSEADLDLIRAQLSGAGWLVYTLPAGICDAAEFFQAIGELMPLDPAGVAVGEWDALADSLRSGLPATRSDCIAIIWPKAQDAPCEDLEVATSVLEQVAGTLGDPEMNHGHCTKLLVLLGGRRH